MTPKQRNALHLYLRRLAGELDSAGYDMRGIIKVPIKPTMQNVKDEMLRPVMGAMYPDKESTEDLSSTEVQELYEVLNRATAERLHISVPWPTEEELAAYRKNGKE